VGTEKEIEGSCVREDKLGVNQPAGKEEAAIPEDAVPRTTWSKKMKVSARGLRVETDKPECVVFPQHEDDPNYCYCAVLEVSVPRGSKIHRVRYYMSGNGTKSSKLHETSAGNHSWAHIKKWHRVNGKARDKIYCVCKNWRKSYPRYFRMAVDWSQPMTDPQ